MTTQPETHDLAEEARELIRLEIARLRQEVAEIQREIGNLGAHQPQVVAQRPAPTQPVGGERITGAHLDAAKRVLAEIGGGDNIVVVPDRVILGVGNHAVTIKDESKVGFFRMGIDKDAYEGVDVDALIDSIGMDTILVHPGVLGDPDALRCGTIWHEHGHVLHGAAENGNVFAHELACLRKLRGKEVAAAFVADHRKGGSYYTETAVNPGLDLLERELGELGFTFQPGEKAQAQQRATAPALEIGKVLRGDAAKISGLVGTNEGLPALAAVPTNGRFRWAGYDWVLLRRDVEYKITATRAANPQLEKDTTYRGSQAQIKGQARSVLEPLPELDGKRAGDTFLWQKSTWQVGDVKEFLEIRVEQRVI